MYITHQKPHYDKNFITVPHIFDDPSGKTSLPIDIKFDHYNVVYLHTNPIKSKIFKFNKFLSNLDAKDFLQDSTIASCNWVDSGFVDKDHRHIVTGDVLKVVNNQLRKLFFKDSKY